jgi:hypothetical protein
LAAADGFDTQTDELASNYAYDDMHGVLHGSPVFVLVALVVVTVAALEAIARRHGLTLNFGSRKTEAAIALRGHGAKEIRQVLLG